ncbi:MAG: hypothetical protein KatS3mg110_2454 [Pirellulaceae bacterium]|nr:MAG: hypothetical protein KatS3mg110_2454 [Pirellulaceae bacterium]
MSETLLPVDWNVPRIIRQRVGKTVGPQRAIFEEGHLLLVLHRPPSAGQQEREGCFVWRTPDGQWYSTHHGSSGEALERFLHEYRQRIETLDQQEERASTAGQYFQVIEHLGPLLRAIRHVHHVLQQAREAVPDDMELLDCRNRAYELERTAEILFQDTKNAMEFLVARRAEDQAAAARRTEALALRLNVLAAVFLPVAVLSGVWEVEPSAIQRHWEQPWTSAGIILAGGLMGAIITWLVSRGRKS